MRFQPETRRTRWTIVPLLLGIGAVMTLCNASVVAAASPGAAAEDTIAAAVLVKCPARLESAESTTPLSLFYANVRTSKLGLLGPLAAAVEDPLMPLSDPEPKPRHNRPKPTPTPRPKIKPHPKVHPKPKPRPKPLPENPTTPLPSQPLVATTRQAPSPVIATPSAIPVTNIPLPPATPIQSDLPPSTVPASITVPTTTIVPVPAIGTFSVPSGVVSTTAAPRPTGAPSSTIAIPHSIVTHDPRPSLTGTPLPDPTTVPLTTVHRPTNTHTTAPSAAPPTTTEAPNSSSSHHTRPTKTTTPWLPSSIVPIAPPPTTSPPTPGTSLPDVVIPNLNPDIPTNSFNVHLRYEHVSYYQVINSGVLAAQLVSFIPEQLGNVLGVDPSQILVLAIRDGTATGSGSPRKMRKRGLVTTNNIADAILVTAAIPKAQYWSLSTLVTNKNSTLYVPGGNTFGQYLDPTFPLSSHPPPSPSSSGNDGSDTGDDGGDATADPLTGALPGTVTNPDGSNGSSSTTNGPVIGSVVGLVTAAYVGIALLLVRRHRSKKLKEQEKREVLQRSISAPISVQGSTQGWGWHN